MRIRTEAYPGRVFAGRLEYFGGPADPTNKRRSHAEKEMDWSYHAESGDRPADGSTEGELEIPETAEGIWHAIGEQEEHLTEIIEQGKGTERSGSVIRRPQCR